MDGKQYIYGVQLGLSYKINDWLSVFAGGRNELRTSGYEGYLKADYEKRYYRRDAATDTGHIELDCRPERMGTDSIIGWMLNSGA